MSGAKRKKGTPKEHMQGKNIYPRPSGRLAWYSFGVLSFILFFASLNLFFPVHSFWRAMDREKEDERSEKKRSGGRPKESRPMSPPSGARHRSAPLLSHSSAERWSGGRGWGAFITGHHASSHRATSKDSKRDVAVQEDMACCPIKSPCPSRPTAREVERKEEDNL